MKSIRVILTLAISMFLFFGCSKNDESSTKTQKSAKTAKKVEQFPIKLQDVNGSIISVNRAKRGFTFSNAKDKVVLLDFFATWCPPCKAEIPYLNMLQKKYKDDVKIISVVLEEKSQEEMRKFIEDYHIQYTIVNGKGNFSLAKAIGEVKSIPFTILYDKQGKYATHYVGAVPEEMIDADIQKVLR